MELIFVDLIMFGLVIVVLLLFGLIGVAVGIGCRRKIRP